MKKSLCKIFLFLLLIFFLNTTPVVHAEVDMNVGVISNVQEVKANEEIIVTLRLDDFVDITKGINAYKATLFYDASIFEEVKTSDFTNLNHWEYLKYNSETHEIVAIHRAGMKEANDVLSVRLKAKENITPTNTIVAFQNVVVSEGKEDLYLESDETSIAVIKEQIAVPVFPSESNQDENGNESNEVDSPSDSSKEPETGEQTNDEESPLDKEDMELSGKNTIWFWILFFAVIDLFFLAYYLYKRYDKDKQHKYKKFLFLLTLSLSLFQFVGSSFATMINLAMLGELNGDGKINYTDVEILERYLIHLEELDKIYLENADMNADKKITVTDLTLLVQKLEKNLDYDVEILDSELETVYFNKNEDILLQFHASVSYGANVEFLKINGQSYPVTKIRDELYSFSFHKESIAGIKELKISEVILDNGKSVKLNHVFQIDILKDLPEFKNYVVTSDINSSKQIIDFDILDPDASVTNATLLVYEEDEIIRQFELQIGHNKVEVPVEDGVLYDVSIIIDYDLKTLESLNGDHEGQFVFEKELLLNIDYQFSLSNIKTYDENNVEITEFEKFEAIDVGFDSVNLTIHEPVSVKINGKTYDQIHKFNNRYYVTIDGFTELGTSEIRVEEVTLANGKVFVLEENNTINTTIIKRKPVLSNFSYEENKETNQMQVDFQLQDEDKSIHSIEIQLLDGYDNEISKVILNGEELNSNEISQLLDTKVTDSYRVKVLVSYVQNEDIQREVFLDQEIVALPRVEIKKVLTDKIYYEKEEVMNVIYEIETNKNAEIRFIRLNNIDCIAQSLGNGKYQIFANAPTSSGVQDLVTSKIIFTDESEIEVSKTVKIEVLKSVPSVLNVKQEDDLNNGAIKFSFEILDEDDSLLTSKAIVIKENDGTAREFRVQKGHNELVIPVENAKIYQLNLQVSYDRDTNTFTTGDNLYENVLLASYDLQLLNNYELTVSNIQTFNQETKTKYFNKNENILLRFESSNISQFKPVQVVINGKTYSLSEQESYYQVEVPGYNNSGIETLHIEKIILSNTYEEEIKDKSVSIHVLKDALSITNFGYERTTQNKLKVHFTVLDTEDTFVDGTARIVVGEDVLLEQAIQVGENSFEIDILGTDITEYHVSVHSSYNLDPAKDSENILSNVLVLNENITLSSYAVELKDVVSNKLFYKNNEVTTLDITNEIPTDLENYYVKIEMENLPTYYADVEKFVLDSDANRLYVVLQQNDFIQYTENNDGFDRQHSYSFPIAYQNSEGVHPLYTSAVELFEAMAENPTGTFVLDEDLDASEVSANNAAVNVTFSGTLDGQGHKIMNLPTVLFATLNKATIQNLVIEDANITNNSKGILANTIENNSVVINTHVLNSSISNDQSMIGGIVGEIKNSTIKQSSVVDISIRVSNTAGGIAGQMSSGSVVEDCYVTGSITGTITYGMGARVGGITGWASGTKIDRVYTKVNLSGLTSLGGLIGGPNVQNPVITNSVSFGNGGYRLSGYRKIANMVNVYEYANSTAISHIDSTVTNIKEIDTMYDKSFYQDVLGFDENIWYFDLVDYEILPMLKNSPLPHDIASYEIETNPNNIPNYAEVRKSSVYKVENEILYYNLSKLKPFSDTRTWLEMANAYSDDSLMAKEKISFIVPLNENNENVLGLTTETVSSITKIRVVYENKESETYEVEHFLNVENLIATYKIEGTNLEYEYDNYLKTIDESLLTQIFAVASNLDYATDIATLTNEEESRLYVDFYNESVKDNLREIFINYLLNDMDTPLYSSNSYVTEMISNAFTEDFIKQFLYAYNYYEKWYHLDLDGIKLSDFLFFNGTKVSSSLNTNYLITSVLNTSESNRATNNTVNFYNAILKGKVNMNFQDFLPYVFKTLNGYDDPSDWIVDHFEGILYEQSATGTYSDEVIYRIWPIMTRNHMHVVLPILSAPQEDMYIITCPSQFIIGSLNRYSTYLNKDGNERTRMYDIIVRYANALGDFYGISAGFIPNAVNLLNTNRVNIQYDTRFYFPASDKADEGTQSAGTTRDPVMKWVYEAIGGAWAAANGAGAYATGYDVWWVVDSALGDINRSIHVFTHETAHNQDGSYFYSGNGRRWYTGAEAHADGVIAQEFGSNAQFFNVTNNFAIESDYATNLTYERINTEEKIDSYYREMFETKYVLEYLAAQAFLRLSYEEQAKVAIQLQYSTTSTSNATSYVRLTAEDFEKMDLQTVADLWDNQIAIRGTGTSPSAQNGSYGFDSFYNFYFHIPNNPKGTSDTNTFKNTGYEMLGFAGYDKGFITYMSGRSTNDLDAIQKITGDSTMTWRTYKLNRYANVEDNLSKITYFDTDEIINLYESAFKKDASNNNLNSSVAVTKLYYGIMKRATNDFRTGGIYSNPEPTSITTAEQLIEAINNNSIGNYRIDADLDFSNISPVEGKTYYIENRFFGTIEGNGHKLLGMKYTLFNSVTYAHVKNITILSPEYSENIGATLALNSNNVVVFNYNVTDSSLNIPAIKNKSGSMFSLGTNDFTMRVHYINSVEDFLAIDDSNISRASKYVLNTDLDFSSFSKESGQSVITGIFTGIIDGNGHTIKNLNNYALFEHFRGSVRNLTIQDFRNVKTGDEVAAFARNSSNATFSDMRFINITLEGRHRVAPVVALDNSGSTFERISVTNINVKGTGFYISGLVGRKYGGVIQDVYVDGDIEIYTTANGGIAGSFERNVTVSRVISNVNISRPRSTDSRLQNGGFVGYLYQNNSRVSDSISLGNMTGFMQDGTEITSGKFVGLQNTSEFIPLTFSNCYEYALATGVSGLVEDAIKEASNEDIYNQNFYKDILHFDETIWDFDSVSEKGYPQLK